MLKYSSESCPFLQVSSHDHRPPVGSPARIKELCHDQNGFNIHGATTVKAHDRKGLLNLIQYMARPALSQNKVRLEGNEVVYELHRPMRSDGIFARNHPLRKHIIRIPGVLRTLSGKMPCPKTGKKLVADTTWCELLKRVFKIDIGTCDKCGDAMLVMAAIFNRKQISRYLAHREKAATGPPI